MARNLPVLRAEKGRSCAASGLASAATGLHNEGGRLEWDGGPCGYPPRYALPVRPAGRPRAACGTVAAGTALSHAGGELFAQGEARAALRELAAGSARE